MPKFIEIHHRTKTRYDNSEIRNDRELYIIQELARMKSVPEVTELCNKKFPALKPLSMFTVRYYKQTRAPIIEQLKNEIIEKSMSIPIANERVRLQRTEKLYQAANTILIKKDMVETSLKCLKEAREEIKGESGSTQNFLQFNQYNEFTNEQLLDKKKELEQKFIELNRKEGVYVSEVSGA